MGTSKLHLDLEHMIENKNHLIQLATAVNWAHVFSFSVFGIEVGVHKLWEPKVKTPFLFK